MVVASSGVLGLTVLFSVTSELDTDPSDLLGMLVWIATLCTFIFVGVVLLINGHFGLKLARMHPEEPVRWVI